MIEAIVRKGSEKGYKLFVATHSTAVTNIGNDGIRAASCELKGAKTDPLLRLRPGFHHACVTNEDLDKGGDNALRRCAGVKLKSRDRYKWKNWEREKTWTTPVDNVKWVKFERWLSSPRNAVQELTLKTQSFPAIINFPVAQDSLMKAGGVNVTQMPVNSNIAATGQKLQGMSKDTLIVND